MRYRILDENGDRVFGHGQRDFYRDQPEAPAQAAKTRLLMWLGEWFIDITDGTDWNTKVLGRHTTSTRDMIIRTRILGTPNVSSIDKYSSFATSDRKFSVALTISTKYGQVNLQGVV